VKINTIANGAADIADVWAASGNTAMMRKVPRTKCVTNAAINREGKGRGKGREKGKMAQVVDA
jgi:hypothetical protein